MISYEVTIGGAGALDAYFERLQTLDIGRVVEAAARNHLNDMKRVELNAPRVGPIRRSKRTGRQYAPERNTSRTAVRRITGQLADTAFIRPENDGLRQVIVFPADYAQFHDARLHPFSGQRDIYVGSIKRRNNQVRREITQGLDFLIGQVR